MYAYSIISVLLEQVELAAAQHHSQAVRRLTVGVGERSGVEGYSLETAFEVIRERTVCAGAELVIRRIPGDEILLERVELEVTAV